MTATISDALPWRSVCICPVEFKGRESGESFEPTGKQESVGWTNETGIVDVSVNASAALFVLVFDKEYKLSE